MFCVIFLIHAAFAILGIVTVPAGFDLYRLAKSV